MIKEEKVKIIIKSKNITYYKKFNLNLKINDVYEIDTIKLSRGSSLIITVICDECSKEKETSFKEYNKYTKNLILKYYCHKCSHIKKRETLLEKYGVKHQMCLDETKEKIKKTNRERYGKDYYLQTDEKKEKSKNTSMLLYGVDNVSKLDITKEKVKKTNKEKYGVDNVSKLDITKEKIKKTNKEKYGNEFFFKTNTYLNKIYNSTKNYWNNKYLSFFNNYNDYEFISWDTKNIKIKDLICGNIFSISPDNLRNRIILKCNLCTECYPISEQQSIKEKEISNWLKELNIDFIEGDRTILQGKELDIYIPSLNLAIEFNGIYWHSEKYKDKNYHLDKSIECQTQGIQLLHIWEDEWVFKQDIVKSIILNKLGKIEEKIYARHCEIKEVNDSKLVRNFLDDNHIQGYSQSSIKLGLYHGDELVSLMSFGYRHTNSKKEFELIRFCNKINLNVVGAASKLFKYFKKNYEFETLISYSDFRLFDGGMYETLGFLKKHLSKPDYFWCKDLERKHRFNFNKKKLIKEGYDSSKTEKEIMWDRGYFRLFGCGQFRWEYKNLK